ARRAVRTQLDAAARVTRKIVERRGRMRLHQYPEHLVVYLLHHGHGALKGLGWRKTVQAFFDLPRPPSFEDDDNAQARAVRDHDAAACRLVGRLGQEPGWKHIG